eukprot:3224275-Alexandrium_andersonii.AAC.1
MSIQHELGTGDELVHAQLGPQQQHVDNCSHAVELRVPIACNNREAAPRALEGRCGGELAPL